jgi:putative ABC transport system permease protein
MSPPTLRLHALLRKGLFTAWSQRLSTTITTLVVAAVCGVILATTGQSAAAEQRVLSRIDEVGTRTLLVETPAAPLGCRHCRSAQ